MAFLDKLQEVAKTVGEKTSETMKVVGDKTNDAVETTKRKAKISQEKSAILDVKKQIGELVWNKYSEGEQMPEDIEALCVSIKEHQAVIDETEKEIENIKAKSDSGAEDVESDEVEEIATEETTEEAAEETVEEDTTSES